MSQEMRELLEQALKALEGSAPWTDALHRWKDPSWAKQRADAIAAIKAKLAE